MVTAQFLQDCHGVSTDSEHSDVPGWSCGQMDIPRVARHSLASFLPPDLLQGGEWEELLSLSPSALSVQGEEPYFRASGPTFHLGSAMGSREKSTVRLLMKPGGQA